MVTQSPSEQIVPFGQTVFNPPTSQQSGLPGGQHSPAPLSTEPDGQHTGAPDFVTTTRSLGQQFLLPGAPRIVAQNSSGLQHLLPATITQHRPALAQQSVPHLSFGFLHVQIPFTHVSVRLSQHFALDVVKQQLVPRLQHVPPFG